MPSRRPDPRRPDARRSPSGSPGEQPRRPRRRLGLWPVTAVLSVTLAVLVAMLVIREQDGGVRITETADAEAVTMTTAGGASAAGGAGAASNPSPAVSPRKAK
ncbi:MAG: hypothetical protein ITG02_03635, partial [Patulibacter sp.]|nr:hypothetical protein [Patulibacter sp.]